MNDLISRQAAIELIERMKPYHQDADDIAEMIANMPSAQPERNKGKWIDKGRKMCCSECGSTYFCTLKFCPECGADMRGEKNNG